MGKVLTFRGKTKLDIEPDKVLEGAKGKLTAVVVIGWDENNESYFASSTADGGDVLYLAEPLKLIVMGVERY